MDDYEKKLAEIKEMYELGKITFQAYQLMIEDLKKEFGIDKQA